MLPPFFRRWRFQRPPSTPPIYVVTRGAGVVEVSLATPARTIGVNLSCLSEGCENKPSSCFYFVLARGDRRRPCLFQFLRLFGVKGGRCENVFCIFVVLYTVKTFAQRGVLQNY
ncbi:hypothetical protein CEXT_346741 [Caerostris extrusa]|uniref:Uncharacterized protein n=1 Tax=Caerostris extrusa TaxID=172846 RepID=A0AAV4NY74_CAEEX|nr:hypothetical protein CEXT_346741 [Caerostris extrusa]